MIKVFNSKVSEKVNELYSELVKKEKGSVVLDNIVTQAMSPEVQQIEPLKKLGQYGIATHPDLTLEVLIDTNPKLAMDFVVLGALDVATTIIATGIPQRELIK